MVANALLWSSTFLFYQKKRKFLGIGSGILFLYAIISIVCIHLYNNPLSIGMFKEQKLIPFLYLYVMIILISLPLLKIKEENIYYIQKPSNNIFNIISFIIIFFSCVSLPNDFIKIKEGLIALVTDASYGKEAYMERAEAFTSKSSSNMDIISILGNMTRNVAPMFLLYYLTLHNKNKFIFYGLILSSILYPIISISTGARSGLVIPMMNMFFLFLFIRKFIPTDVKKKIKYGMYLLCIILLIPFLLVTISRTDGNLNETFFSIERYLSEGFLRFNNYGLDANGYRYGDYTIVVFKKFLGLDPPMYYSSRLLKYSHMLLNESVFYTFVGDFTLDYGPIIALIIFIILSRCFYNALKIKKRSILFHQYILLYLLTIWCIGFFQFILGRIEGNLLLIFLILLYFVFKCDYYYNRN